MARPLCFGLLFLALTPLGSASPRLSALPETLSRERAQQLDELDSYTIAVPRFVNRKKRELNSTELHPEKVNVILRVNDETFLLVLEKSRYLISRNFQLTYYTENGFRVSSTPSALEHCYYQGVVAGYLESQVSLSTCSGFRGLLLLANRTLAVEPLAGDVDGLHIVYHLESVRTRGRCGLVDEHEGEHVGNDLPIQESTLRLKRDLISEMKYVEVYLVADNREYQSQSKDVKKVQNRMIELAHQVDLFYRPLNVRVALIGVEVWSNGDLIQRDYSSSDTLKRFLEWRRTDLLRRVAHDNAQLVAGGIFEGGTAGRATQGTMCSRDRSGGVNLDHSYSVFAVASTIAHEIGHNFGMNHDTPKRKCNCPVAQSKGGCIMQTASGFIPGQMFSSCSRDDLERSLRRGGGMCLFNVPSSSSLYGGARCGNLYVEETEECDCGLPLECDDPCCNASVCKLIEGAQCAKGRCCKDCKVIKQGIVCRKEMNECDLPEMCDGKSGNCPGNVYLKDGAACQDGEAYCYNGFCLTREEQCVDLFGEGATAASEMCYKTVNTQGVNYGNCGEDSNGKFIACSLSNAICGKLQCKGGQGKPQLATEVSVVETKFEYMGKKYICRGISYNLGDDVSDPGIVNPGTKCGLNKACENRTCLGIEAFGVSKCLEKCNGHGVCNSNENCHCDIGRAPPTCANPGNGGSIDSGPYTERTTTSNPEMVTSQPSTAPSSNDLSSDAILTVSIKSPGSSDRENVAPQPITASSSTDLSSDAISTVSIKILESSGPIYILLAVSLLFVLGGLAAFGWYKHGAIMKYLENFQQQHSRTFRDGQSSGQTQHSEQHPAHSDQRPAKPPPPQKPLPVDPAGKTVFLPSTNIPNVPHYPEGTRSAPLRPPPLPPGKTPAGRAPGALRT
uniref:disintegrin and metalloproteinase domain-containing protein 12-like isoform X2 n=1 Tax=Myxine glutinosa TaxID=7769 RepID=UPI00358E64B1